MTAGPAAGPPPTGRRLRWMTRRVQDAREGRGWATVAGEVWGGLVTLAVVTVLAGWSAMGMDLRPPAPAPGSGGPPVAGDLPGLLVLVVVAGGLLSLAGRLGPVGVGEGGAGWWLPLPVDRRGLLRPAVLAWPPAAALTGAVVAPLAVLTFGAPATVGRVLAWTAIGGTLLGSLAAGAVLAQGAGRAGRSSRTVGLAGDAVMVAGTLGLVALSLVPAVPSWSLGADARLLALMALPAPVVVAAPLLAVAVTLTVLAEQRAGDLDGGALRTFGAVGGRVRVAILSLDLRELGRALTSASVRVRHRSRALRPGGPRRAVVLADAFLVVRTPRSLVQAAVATLLAVSSAGLPVVGEGLPRYVVLLVTGYWAVNAVAGGARHGDLVPALGRLLPLDERWVRFAHLAVPLAVATVWASAVLGSTAALDGDASWLLLAPSWAIATAVGTLRGAYRPPPRFRSTQISSPLGGVPSAGGMFQGFDAALVATAPTGVLLWSDAPVAGVAAVQTALTVAVAAAVLWSVGRRPD